MFKIFELNTSGEYEGRKIYAGGDRIKSFAINGFAIEVNEISLNKKNQ
ncbi:MAG: hypothetical protein ACTHOF_17385 [Flavisolibacter sp.]|jgi:hypothetical protein